MAHARRELNAARRKRTAALGFALALAAGMTIASLPAYAQITMRSPAWAQLSPQEQKVLAPLAPEWDKLDAQRKTKWRGLAQRYPSMTPDKQQRVQQQMHSWAQLSPQERAVAREQYKTIKQLPPDKKAEFRQRWQEYQSLPPETRRELAMKPAAPAGHPTTAPKSRPPNPAPAAPGARP